MSRLKSQKKITITTGDNPKTKAMLYGAVLTQTGKVHCALMTWQDNMTIRSMMMAQAELDKQSSESIMELVDHIDDVLRIWFGNPVVARNNLKHIADCLDEISRAFSEKSCNLYQHCKSDESD